MRTIPATIDITSEVVSLSTCVRVIRRDGSFLRYTDNTRDLVISGNTYKAYGGYDLTAIVSSIHDSTGNVDLSGFFETPTHRQALRGGLLDNARVDIFQVSRESLPASDTQGNVLWLFSGYTGNAEVKPDGHGYSIEARSLIQMLQQNVGKITSAICRADFGSLTGDEPCMVNPAGYTATATVSSVSLNRLIKAPSLTQILDYFTSGKLTWTTGANVGNVEHVAQYTTGVVILLRPAALTIQPGDTFSIIAGCDHTIGTCTAKFNNAINFKGEPFMPGFDSWFARPVL